MSLIKNRRTLPSLRPAMMNLFDFDNFFDLDFTHEGLIPAVNIKDNPMDYEIELAAPGRSKKDFNISISEGVLSISSEKEESKEAENKNYTRKEFSYSSFRRSFALPKGIHDDKVRASYQDGVLTIKLGKKKEEKALLAKEIKVN